MLKKTLKRPISDAEAAGIAAQLDRDGDGKVRPLALRWICSPLH